MNRYEISKHIIKRLNEIGINNLKKKYDHSSAINYLVIEDLLPIEIAIELSEKMIRIGCE